MSLNIDSKPENEAVEKEENGQPKISKDVAEQLKKIAEELKKEHALSGNQDENLKPHEVVDHAKQRQDEEQSR